MLPPSRHGAKTYGMIRSRLIWRWAFRAFTCLALLAAAFMVLAFAILREAPEELAASYLSEISEKTGIKIKFGSVDVVFLPLPALTLSELEAQGNGLDFRADWLSARPDYALLLRGRLAPAQVELLRPRLALSLDGPLGGFDKAAASLEKFFQKLPPGKEGGLENCDLRIVRGRVDLVGSDGASLELNDLDCGASLSSGWASGLIRLGALKFEKGRDILLRLDNLSLAGNIDPANFMAGSSFNVSGMAARPGLIWPSAFSARFNGAEGGWLGGATFEGALDLSGAHVPAALALTLAGQGPGKIEIKDLSWLLDADSGGFSGTLSLPEKLSAFRLEGVFTARRVSLTQWFGFARNLNPGLQLALDNVEMARIPFSLTAKSLKASNISAACKGYVFRGEGGVENFAKPVVFLNLASKKANLGLAIPEALGRSPVPPHFPYPPLTPMPGKPLRPGETDIGYDIRLASAKLLYGPLTITRASLRIHPGKKDASGLEDVLLDGKGDFYGGKISGACILGADPSLPMNITGEARDVNGAPLAADMPALPFRQGRFSASLNVWSKGKTLDRFLRALKGPIKVQGKKVTLEETGPKEVFQSFESGLELRSAGMSGQRLGMDGQWSASLASESYKGELALDGRIYFGRDGFSFNDAKASLKGSLTRALGSFPAGLSGRIKGILSGRQGKFSMSKATVEALGISGGGDFQLETGARPICTGLIKASIPDLAKTLRQAGFRGAAPPAGWRALQISSSFRGERDSISLSGLKAAIGGISAAGSLEWRQKGGRPAFDFSLALDRLGFEKSFSQKKGGDKWNFEALKTFDARGDLRVRNLKIWKLSFEDARLPLRLEKGQMKAGPFTARFYESSFNGRANMDFNHGLNVAGTFSARNFNLAKAARAADTKGELKGQASIGGDINLHAQRPSGIPAALNGSWNFSVSSGSWRGVDKKGAPSGKTTFFDTAKASGIIVNGRMESKNFLLRGPDMRVSGKGWLNLVSDKIDCELEASLRGLPDFPLYIYGPLQKPKTSIGAGKMVVNAIGGVATGAVDILGGAFNGLLKIFR